jgi:hypothetical protein
MSAKRDIRGSAVPHIAAADAGYKRVPVGALRSAW